ncbi:MAG: GerMN domain-containing protein [Cellulosilyticaceae bacterium]
MKSKLLILLSSMLMITILAIGCSNKVNKNDTIIVEEVTPILPEKPVIGLETYLPIIKDTVWEYTGNQYDENSTVWIDFIKENVFQIRIESNLTIMAKVYIEEDGAIYEVATIEDARIKQDYTNFRQYKQAVLKLPIEEGQSWIIEEGITRTITEIDMQIETAIGTMKAIEVTTEGDSFIKKDYYGEKTGLVKTVYKDNEGKSTQELSSFETSKPVEQQIRVYLGNGYTSKLMYTDQKIPVRTNEEPKHFLTDVLKKVPSEEYALAIPKSALIESIYLDEETKKLYLDMSKEYYDMNYGSGMESLAVQSLVTTVGAYYDVKQVVLTVAGEPYQTGHIAYKIGESIPIKFEDINEIVR